MYICFNENNKQKIVTRDLDHANLFPDEIWEQVEDFDTKNFLMEKVEGVNTLVPKPVKTPVLTYRIYEFMHGDYDATAYPGDIPYHIFGLVPKYSVILGLRQETLYLNPNDETDEIVKVSYLFQKEPGKTCMETRKRKIYFKMSDGSWSPIVKETTKKYNTSLKKQKELRARRENIIEQLKSLAEEMGILERVEELFSLYSKEGYLYTNSGSLQLRDAILNDTVTLWLNENLPNGYPARETIASYFAIGTSLDT